MPENNPLEIIERIYKAHYVYLHNFLMGLTKDDELADEIIQELFAKLLLQPQMIQDVGYMKSWLVKSAKNTLIDHYRKKTPDLLDGGNRLSNPC